MALGLSFDGVNTVLDQLTSSKTMRVGLDMGECNKASTPGNHGWKRLGRRQKIEAAAPTCADLSQT